MSIFGAVITGLETPDNQGRDWYGWAANQMAHAMLGVIVALSFPKVPLEMALIIGALKECTDLLRVPTMATAKDSLCDAAFWVLGAWVACASDLTLAVWFLSFALICGVIPRARKAAAL